MAKSAAVRIEERALGTPNASSATTTLSGNTAGPETAERKPGALSPS